VLTAQPDHQLRRAGRNLRFGHLHHGRHDDDIESVVGIDAAMGVNPDPVETHWLPAAELENPDPGKGLLPTGFTKHIGHGKNVHGTDDA
jgi:hypothetical protein